MTREASWEFFRDSAPANIKFIELLSLQDPANLKLLSTLSKAYAGYAFAVPETLALGDGWQGREDSPYREQALGHYTRALDYGLKYLDKRGVKRQDLLSLNEEDLNKKLKAQLRERDIQAVLYTAQAWGSLIQLQQDNISLVSQVPKVKVLFDWVCGQQPNIDNGVCDIFYAQYEASRPRMLGGNPKKAAELYQLAMQKYPRNLLIRVGHIQYMLLPGFEQDKYEIEAALLRKEFQKWSNRNRDNLEDTSEYGDHADLNLYNAIARKRFELIEQNKKKIF